MYRTHPNTNSFSASQHHSIMSYLPTRNYARPIFRPVWPSTQFLYAKAGQALQQPATTSSLWTATTHTFVGILDRDIHPAWPPGNFWKIQHKSQIMLRITFNTTRQVQVAKHKAASRAFTTSFKGICTKLQAHSLK